MEKNEASEPTGAGLTDSRRAPLSTSTFQRHLLRLSACLNSPVSPLSPSNCQGAVASHQRCTCCFTSDHQPTSAHSRANLRIGRPLLGPFNLTSSGTDGRSVYVTFQGHEKIIYKYYLLTFAPSLCNYNDNVILTSSLSLGFLLLLFFLFTLSD